MSFVGGIGGFEFWGEGSGELMMIEKKFNECFVVWILVFDSVV